MYDGIHIKKNQMDNIMWTVPDPADGRKVILIDLDNTMVSSTDGIVEWAKARSDVEVDVESDKYHVGSWHPTLQLRQAFEEEEFFYNLKPYPDAIEAVKALARIHDVIICSAPTSHLFKTSADQKTRWINDFLPTLDGKPTRLILCDDKTLVRGDYLIDDSPHIEERGIYPNPIWQQVVFKQSYNISHALQSNKPMIPNWKHVLDQINKN